MIPFKKIALEKKKIVENCNKCKGVGCSSCFGYLIFIDKMADSCIPIDYWYRLIEDFYGDKAFKNFILEYINNLNNEFDKGLTICFTGERGCGKTMGSCSILKKAILKDYSTYYITLSDFVSNVVGEHPEIRFILKEYDFIVIDEIDQRFFPTYQSMELYGNQLENILRSRMQNHLPTIMCSNSADTSQIFGGEFKKSFDSLGSQFIKVVPVIGKDARKGKEKL